ncbi:MAG: protein transport protein Sec61 subunit beta, partial [Olpidium bornovanus]
HPHIPVPLFPDPDPPLLFPRLHLAPSAKRQQSNSGMAEATSSAVGGVTTPASRVRSRARGAASRASGPTSRVGASTPGMMRLYTDDSPGLKVDPVVVLVLSLAFIASVFMLHIYGKLTRS